MPFRGAQDVNGTDQTQPEPANKSFAERIDDAIANLADVTVATLITDVTVSVDERGRLKTVTAPNTAKPAIITNMNLIDGNVTTIIGPTIKDDSALTTLHQGLLDNAVKVLPDNLKALAKLVEDFFGKLKTKV